MPSRVSSHRPDSEGPLAASATERRLGGLIARASMAVMFAALILPLYWGELVPMLWVGFFLLSTSALTRVLRGEQPRLWALATQLDVLLIAVAAHYLGTSSQFLLLLAPTVLGYALVSGKELGPTTLLTSILATVVVLWLHLFGLSPAAAHVPDSALWQLVLPGVLVVYALAGVYTQGTLGIRQVERDMHASWQEEQERSRELEAQLETSRRLESLGRLAGGVAHDFNNQLTAIIGFTSMVRDALPSGSEHEEDLEEVIRAARSAQGLTADLMAFGRQEVHQPRATRLVTVVRSSQRLLRRTVRESIALSYDLDESTGYVQVDTAQIERALVNLVGNASDAIEGQGEIHIGAHLEQVGESLCAAHFELRPGPYAVLTVADDGVGMDATTASRIFEPFFTTKEPGRGSGMGLASTYGVVRQNDGAILVDSAPGQGTRMRLYLPSVDAAETGELSIPSPPPSEEEPTGERALVVEDDPLLLTLVERILASAGFEVFTAEGSSDALRGLDQGEIPLPRLLVTDVIMPGRSGGELDRALRERHPRLQTVFISGYDPKDLARRGLDTTSGVFLAKPFERDQLLSVVQSVLST